MTDAYLHQGKGQKIQKELLTNWYRGLQEAPERGEKVAYLFISGNIGELLQNFGFHLVYPEVNALQCGVKKVAEPKASTGDPVVDIANFILGVEKSSRAVAGRALAKITQGVCEMNGCTKDFSKHGDVVKR